MTVLMTLTGLIVFVFSIFFVPFKVALKRLWIFVITGAAIDVLIISISLLTGYIALH